MEYSPETDHAQSPIALCEHDSHPVKELKPLLLEGYFNDEANYTIVNTGTNAYCSFTYSEGHPNPAVSGGPLIGKYTFDQLHFHWSTDDVTGSEHIIDDKCYAMECHFVHRNEKYDSIDEALNNRDGLAVLSFLFSMGVTNESFEDFANAVRQISTPSSRVNLKPASLSWSMKPELYSTYFTYEGSLSTPPFSECVTWIIFDKPIEIGPEQIAAFRALKDKEDKLIENNVSPIQPTPCGQVINHVNCSTVSFV